ncbi:cobalt/nickel transport system ATP-binding protein [Anaerotaenia torta]|uniref:energy-coupling factor ABC transporter ATP-binding protein n=1 Tax=Anaerotaenia torta TaxID=433293 RepID=UPI003D1DC2C9
MKEKLLEVKNLSFTYDGDRTALKDVSITIFRQEKIAVLGANGAGKSTFFLNLNGVREPAGGEIYYRGEAIGRKNKNKLRRKVGIIFQDPDHQMIASTVKAEVAFGPLNMGLPREETERRTMDAIRTMGLEEYLLRPPHYLSGGEKKRVSIADILAMDSEIMIFDEPTASLDPANAGMLEKVLDQIGLEGKTILLSTHDVDFAYRFADRILVFHEGCLIGDGTPEDIFREEELLKTAHLKKPVLMEVHALLVRNGLLPEQEISSERSTGKEVGCPRSLEELEELLKNNYFSH